MGPAAGDGVGFLQLVCVHLDFAVAIGSASKRIPGGLGAKSGVVMRFDSLNSFLEMGGYAVYVFGSYGLTVAVMAGLVFTALKQRRVFFEGYRSADTRDTDKKDNIEKEDAS